MEDEGEATERCGEDAVTDRTGDFDATGLQGETSRRRDAKTKYGHDLFPSNTHNLVFGSTFLALVHEFRKGDGWRTVVEADFAGD